MLQLILGLSGTGKTSRIVAQLKSRAEAGQRSLFMVPEQFTSSAETMIYTALGDAGSAFVTVYSFTRFAEAVLKTYGGLAMQTITDAGRVVLVRRAMDGLGDALQSYHRHRRNTGFCSLCADAIKELKIAGATPTALLDTAATLDEDGVKLRELGLIFAAYEGLLSGSVMDPSDRVVVAAQRLQPAFLAQTAVFIDNFEGFTAPEYEMLRRLVQAESCTVALCCDALSDAENGLGLFSPVKHTAAHLRRLAAQESVGVAAPLLFEKNLRHQQAPGLAHVAALLAGAAPETVGQDASGVYLTLADSVYDACKTVAAQMAQLARQGVPYRSMAVICRQLEPYAAALQTELSLAEIPYFTDESTTPEHTAPAAFFRAALGILERGISTELVLRLLKTGLCGMAPQEIAAAENYAYTWQLRSADWRLPFIKNPAGFGAQIRQEDESVRSDAESVRTRVIPKLDAFLAAAKGENAAVISKELYLLLEAFGGSANLQTAAENFAAQGEPLRSEALYRTWNTTMALLDEMSELLQTDTVTAAEYDDLWVLLLRASDIGHVPQTQNTVMVTTADRMRLANPTHCFILGVSEGEFPKVAGFSGLLTHSDRALLVQSGIEMPGSYENRMLLEKMFFYRALTAPSVALYLSAVSPAAGGAPLCAALAVVAEHLAPQPLRLTLADKASTPAAALDLLGMYYRDDTPETAALAAVLALQGETKKSLYAMEQAANPTPYHADNTQTLQQLLGNRLMLSPTRIEQYYKCRFSYFLEYVLHIKPRKKAELSPLESGSLVHYILEHALRRSGAAFVQLSQEALAELADTLADEYVAENMPQAGVRFAYLIDRLKKGVTRLLCFLQEEQAQSDFHPVAFEQEIGMGEGAVPPLTLHTPAGQMVQVVGKIDRVDTMERGGNTYVRVVDYKTGDKVFQLDEVYCGLNTQMLFYLFTLCNHAAEKDKNPIASGVLYLSGDPTPKGTDRVQAALPPTYKIDGLVLQDEIVVRGMDKHATGLFVPLTFGKNERPRASEKLASLEKLGAIEKHLESLVFEMARGLYAGEIDAVPLCNGAHVPCDVCDYRPVCRHESGKNEAAIAAPPKVFEPQLEGGEQG